MPLTFIKWHNFKNTKVRSIKQAKKQNASKAVLSQYFVQDCKATFTQAFCKKLAKSCEIHIIIQILTKLYATVNK